GRRRYDDFTMLDETGRPDSIAYTPPPTTVRTFQISRHFFTSLWVFTLTDAEIAMYLMLCFLRGHFPRGHEITGVYITDDVRQNVCGITRATYRSHDMLHRFGLIDRMPDPDRDYQTGKVLDFGEKYARGKGSVKPHTFKINDEALQES